MPEAFPDDDLGDDSDVIVPRWALAFMLYRYRYRHGMAHRDGPTVTAESILQGCLDTQRSTHIDGGDS